MRAEEAILGQWFARAVESFSGETARFLATEKDQFRNPVGCTLRENLAVLLRELLGEMDPACTKPALEAIIRVRAVQDLTVAQAAGFIVQLQPILAQLLPELDVEPINSRIEQLAQLAFEEYGHCREQLAEIRENEKRRAMAIPAAMARVRS